MDWPKILERKLSVYPSESSHRIRVGCAKEICVSLVSTLVKKARYLPVHRYPAEVLPYPWQSILCCLHRRRYEMSDLLGWTFRWIIGRYGRLSYTRLPGESCSEFLYIIGRLTFDRHRNDRIRDEDRFLNEFHTLKMFKWPTSLPTYHADLIGFIIDECVTGSAIESVKCTDISCIRFVDFLKKWRGRPWCRSILITDDVTSALFECIRTSLETRVRFIVRMLYIMSPRFTPPW